MYYLGIDIGTTGTKTIVVDGGGAVLSKGYKGYGLISDGNKIEQDADDWTDAVCHSVRAATASIDMGKIAAISLSTQGASTVAVDKDDRPLANAYTWMDNRAAEEAALLAGELGKDYFYRNTGWRLSPSLDAPKIMNMKKQYPEACKFYSTLEYANLFLTGNPAIDPTNASIRLLYNIHNDRWDENILSAANISESELAAVLPTGAPVGKITEKAADATGLPAGVPVYNGAHDQYCASLGCAATDPGDMLLSAGTTWVVMGIGGKPVTSKSFIASAKHPVAGLYGAMASLVGSGASLQWFRDNFAEQDFDEINRALAKRDNGKTSPVFFPYMYGPSFPLWQENTSGAFTGIRPEHGRYDFVQAIMESAAFNVKMALDNFAENGCGISSLKIMGGAAKSPYWCKLIASCCNISVEVMAEPDACALGAAVIAAYGNGDFPSYRAAAECLATASCTIEPEAGGHKRLRERYAAYQETWAALSRTVQPERKKEI